LVRALSAEAVGELVVKELVLGISKGLVLSGVQKKQRGVLKRDPIYAATFSYCFVSEGDK